MTLTASLALLAAMGILAAIPSSSVLLVVTQSAVYGVKNGLAAACGIVAGDLIFVTIAMLGMTALAEQMGGLFIVIKFLAAAYLIWFGIGLLRSGRKKGLTSNAAARIKRPKTRLSSSFSYGLLLTLGDIKAIFFYASLLPAFIDLTRLTAADMAIVSGITVIGVGSVKCAYAILAVRCFRMTGNTRLAKKLNLTSGGLLIVAGTYIMLRD